MKVTDRLTRIDCGMTHVSNKDIREGLNARLGPGSEFDESLLTKDWGAEVE
jgi:hypothetical protein